MEKDHKYVEKTMLRGFVARTEEEFSEMYATGRYVSCTIKFSYTESNEVLVREITVFGQPLLVTSEKEATKFAYDLSDEFFDYLESITGIVYRG